jgi:hypothetical protein
MHSMTVASHGTEAFADTCDNGHQGLFKNKQTKKQKRISNEIIVPLDSHSTIGMHLLRQQLHTHPFCTT